jgi:hypothetical protein
VKLHEDYRHKAADAKGKVVVSLEGLVGGKLATVQQTLLLQRKLGAVIQQRPVETN